MYTTVYKNCTLRGPTLSAAAGAGVEVTVVMAVEAVQETRSETENFNSKKCSSKFKINRIDSEAIQ